MTENDNKPPKNMVISRKNFLDMAAEIGEQKKKRGSKSAAKKTGEPDLLNSDRFPELDEVLREEFGTSSDKRPAEKSPQPEQEGSGAPDAPSVGPSSGPSTVQSYFEHSGLHRDKGQNKQVNRDNLMVFLTCNRKKILILNYLIENEPLYSNLLDLSQQIDISYRSVKRYVTELEKVGLFHREVISRGKVYHFVLNQEMCRQFCLWANRR